MKNKGFLLSLFIAGSLTANAQDIKEWLSLTPIKMEKPALSHVKNVKDQVFTDAMLTDYSGVNIGSLVPDADSKENHFHRLRWTVAPMNRDTVTAGEKRSTDAKLLRGLFQQFRMDERKFSFPAIRSGRSLYRWSKKSRFCG